MEMGGDFNLDHELDGLREKGGLMKRLAGDIQEESALQRDLLNGLEETVNGAKVALKRNMKKMNKAFRQLNSNHVLYLVGFVLLTFLAMYVWAKVYRAFKFVGVRRRRTDVSGSQSA